MVRSRWCAAMVLLGVLLTPVPAQAEEEPGYGGSAQSVTVDWEDDGGGDEGLAVYGVGFRSGSPIVLRVGSSPDRTVHADESGALRVLVLSAADMADARPAAGMTVVPIDADRFATGVSVQAVGQDPAGGVRTLVGAVPPRTTTSWIRDVAPWAALVAVLAASALLTRRTRPTRPRPGRSTSPR